MKNKRAGVGEEGGAERGNRGDIEGRWREREGYTKEGGRERGEGGRGK